MDKIIDFYKFEDDIESLKNLDTKKRDEGIRKIVKDTGINFSTIRKQIKIREKSEKDIEKKKKKVKTSWDLPVWKDETRCPMCNSKLVKKWEGLACINNCPLNFKLGKGWVYLQGNSGWSNSRYAINSILGNEKRNYLQKKFAKLKKEILIRDDYKCRYCGYVLDLDFFYSNAKQLEVHHIVPACEEMALYLDKDNLITLCKKCHEKIHCHDKHSFSKGVKNEAP